MKLAQTPPSNPDIVFDYKPEEYIHDEWIDDFYDRYRKQYAAQNDAVGQEKNSLTDETR